MRTPFTRPHPAAADTDTVAIAAAPGEGRDDGAGLAASAARGGVDAPARGPGRRLPLRPAAEGRSSGRARRPAGIRQRVVRVTAALAVLCGAALTGLGPGAVPAVAAPQPMGTCTTSSGVVLAVDFSHWGGPLLRSCGTTPTTGYTLLNQGGWATTGTQHDGPAFICRIGYGGYQGGKQYPTSKDESCVLTPPATAYWSYWHADPGQNSWSYSQSGSMSYHPKPGSVDLWTFGATNVAGTEGRPAFSPDTVRAHNTAPGSGGSGGGSGGGSSGGAGGGSGSGGTTHRPPAAGGGSGSKGTAGGKASASPRPSATHPVNCPSTQPPTKPTPTATGAPASGTSTPTVTSSHCPSPAGTASTAAGSTPSGSAAADGGKGSPSTPAVVDADPTAAAGHSSGSVLPVVITVCVVALIGVAAFVQVRRRRRTE